MSVPFPPHRRVPRAEAIASAALPRRVKEALQALHDAIFELIVDPLDRLIPEIEARLAHVRDRGAQHAVGVSYIEQSQLLARRQSMFILRFARNVDEELAGLRAQARHPRPGAESLTLIPTFEDMRLVEEDEADEQTEVKAIALRHESRAPLPIHLLCQRLAVLAESPAFDPGTLPVGPRRLCEMMLAAGDACGFSLALRIALLREFERGVLAHYAGVAEALNDLLARLRIMPGLSYVPIRPRARVASGDAAAATAPAADGERPHTGWTGAAPADLDGTTFQLLQELLAARRSMADRFRGGGFGAADDGAEHPAAPLRPELPSATVLELLAGAGEDVAGLDIEAIRQWLLLQARHRLGGPVVLARHDADVFELLGLMLAHLQRGMRPGSAAAAMLDRLRLPLLRTALADAGVFLQASHPARELLNAVAEAGARWYAPDDVDPQLLLHLERIVDGVARSREEPGAAFRAAVAALEPQMQAVARRSEITERRNVEAARGKDKLAIARRRASDVIEAALATARVPVFHRGVLRHAWADALTLAHLRNGDDSAEWTSLVAATEALVRAAAGRERASPDLALLVDQWLTTVGYHEDDAARVARVLTGGGDDDGDDAATRTELALRLKSRARLGEDALADDAARTPLDADGEAQARRLRGLPPGTWLEVPGEDGEPMRRRLSWTSPVTGLALLVNPRGQRVADTTVSALARDLAAGRARVVTADDGRLVDRAWRAALHALGAGDAGTRRLSLEHA